MPPEPAILAEGVSFHYPGTRALDRVGFRIERGSVTALVGPNGAGKSTLLRCLAGLERPLTGAIAVAGVDVLEEPRLAHRHMGYLSDFFGLYDALTVRQCLLHAASVHGVAMERLERTVTATAARLDLADRLDQRCAALSRGMRQRVAIGQAIVHAPAVLMLDEPASGLDPEARHALATLFTRLRDEGMTLIVSSHILAELDEYSTHMLVLRDGRVVEHRALHAAAVDARRIRIALATDDPRLPALLAAARDVRVIEADGRAALVALVGSDADAARLLRELVSADLPVVRFATESENLHESYLRTLRAPAERAP